jgi:hypothetical protein
MVGLNSPFGLIGQIKEKRGYTHRQVMWGQPWLMFVLEMADQPRYVKKSIVPTFDNSTSLKTFLNGTGRDRHKA